MSSPPRAQRHWFAAAIALAVTGSGLAGFLLWQWLQTAHRVSGVVQGECDLNRAPCRALFPGGGVLTVSVTPYPVPLAAPITVEVQLSELAAGWVEINLSSPNLTSVNARHRLTRQADGRFAAQTVLPLCANERATWTMQVTAHQRRSVHDARFRFETAAAAHRRG